MTLLCVVGLVLICGLAAWGLVALLEGTGR